MFRRNRFLGLAAAMISTLLAAYPALAASRSTCPPKVLDTGVIEGVYQGLQKGDYCHVSLKLDNGEEFSLFADEDYALKIFGANAGQRVSVTYNVEQFWVEEAGDCVRAEVMTAGQVLAASSGQAAPKTAVPAQYSRIIAFYREYILHPDDDNAIENILAKVSQELNIEPGLQNDEKAYQLESSMMELPYAARNNKLGYALRDLNSDGVPELFILVDDFSILAIYSLKNDLPVLAGAYWSRHRCVLDKSGTLYINGSSGSEDSFAASYSFKGGDELQLIEMVGLESWDEKKGESSPQPRYYRIQNGNKTIIGQKHADALWEKFPDEHRHNPTKDSGLIFTPLN